MSETDSPGNAELLVSKAEQKFSDQPTGARRNRQRSAVYAQTTLQQFSGPLPPPEILGSYEAVLPGSADRIITMAEKQQVHRENIETRVIAANIRQEQFGLAAGFILALTVISGSLLAIFNGKDIVGLVGIIGSVGSLATIFLYSRSKDRAELQEKRKMVNAPGQIVPLPPASDLSTRRDKTRSADYSSLKTPKAKKQDAPARSR